MYFILLGICDVTLRCTIPAQAIDMRAKSCHTRTVQLVFPALPLCILVAAARRNNLTNNFYKMLKFTQLIARNGELSTNCIEKI